MSTKTKSVDELFREWKKDPKFRTEYDALEEEFTLAAALIDARRVADMTQGQLAERMKTTQASVARAEGGQGNLTVKTLNRWAAATGTRLKISFEPQGKL